MRWPYTKRSDGRIAVTIDSNVWNMLSKNSIDLSVELPIKEFALFIPRQIEIELHAIPDIETKKSLRDFICETIVRAEVGTASNFGYSIPGGPQRLGGFGQGTFVSPIEADIQDELRRYIDDKPTGSGLMRNEGDAALAVLSFFSVVLTNELPGKPGPLRFAFENGGRVSYLHNFAPGRHSLRERVLICHNQI
jgi:hypothetical protein